MKKLTLFILAALVVFSFARPYPAQAAMPEAGQEQAAAMPDNDAAMPDEGNDNESDDDAGMSGPDGCVCHDCANKEMCAEMGMPCGKMGRPGMMCKKMGMDCDNCGMMGRPGTMGRPGMMCKKMGMDCKNCGNMGRMGMMGKMGMMGGGVGGMRGDVDMMTWPPMNKSCRTPEFYLQRAEGLGLSDEQVASEEKLAAALRKEKILKGAAVKALELDLSEIVTKTDFKLDDAMNKLAEIEKARMELRGAVLKYSSDARDVLSPEQLDKVKELGARRCYMCGFPMPGREGTNPGDMKQMMMEKMKKEMMNQ